jgi:hypothetical protein
MKPHIKNSVVTTIRATRCVAPVSLPEELGELTPGIAIFLSASIVFAKATNSCGGSSLPKIIDYLLINKPLLRVAHPEMGPGERTSAGLVRECDPMSLSPRVDKVYSLMIAFCAFLRLRGKLRGRSSAALCGAGENDQFESLREKFSA